jgi:hypothetical protein
MHAFMVSGVCPRRDLRAEPSAIRVRNALLACMYALYYSLQTVEKQRRQVMAVAQNSTKW